MCYLSLIRLLVIELNPFYQLCVDTPMYTYHYLKIYFSGLFGFICITENYDTDFFLLFSIDLKTFILITNSIFTIRAYLPISVSSPIISSCYSLSVLIGFKMSSTFFIRNYYFLLYIES